jgi:predicted nucleic acid-binding Zn ribbon protein
MPLYVYKHPTTGEEFEVIRSYADANKPYKAPDGHEVRPRPFPQPALRERRA